MPLGIGNCPAGYYSCGKTCCGPDTVRCGPNGLCGKAAPPPKTPGTTTVTEWSTNDCNAPPGTGCTQDSTWMYQINGHDFQVLTDVTVGIYNPDGSVRWQGGAFEDPTDFERFQLQTPVEACQPGESNAVQGFAMACDVQDQLCSKTVPVWVGCGAGL